MMQKKGPPNNLKKRLQYGQKCYLRTKLVKKRNQNKLI